MQAVEATGAWLGPVTRYRNGSREQVLHFYCAAAVRQEDYRVETDFREVPTKGAGRKPVFMLSAISSREGATALKKRYVLVPAMIESRLEHEAMAIART